jgi:predicted nucleotidyltransferase
MDCTMATASPLPIFRSSAQAKLLTHLFVTGVDKPLSLSAISNRTGIPLSTVQREIEQLAKAGVVASERIGNTRLVHANADSPYFGDLRSLMLKAFGPTTLLESLLRRVPRVEDAFIYGSWARRYRDDEDVVPRDLDLLIVGTPAANHVYEAARRAERDLDIEVNPLIISREEWEHPRGLVKRIKDGPLVELELDRAEAS